MNETFLHEHPDFPELLKILAEKKGIHPILIEKDYWLMHALYGLQKQDFDFELKGGTSLSKAYQIINRFSEDIDIQINPPEDLNVIFGKNKNKSAHIQSRIEYYDWLASNIKIPGIISVERDKEFDATPNYGGAGIRLHYKSHFNPIDGVKDGILLEVGFDDVTPNHPLTISSWAYDEAITQETVKIIDNRTQNVKCYDYRYTFVEKLQTIVRKYRIEVEKGEKNLNFLRQYYDIYQLLGKEEIIAFIGSEEYANHKKRRFSNKDLEIPIDKFEGFLFSDPTKLEEFRARFKETEALYYNGQPDFEEILARIKSYLEKL